MSDLTVEGLPASIDAEQLVIGGILTATDGRETYQEMAAILDETDFSLDKHRRIWSRIKDLFEADSNIDYVTLGHELQKRNELELVDGMSYLVTLSDGLPPMYNLEQYARIVKEASVRRRVIFQSQNLIQMATLPTTPMEELIGEAESGFSGAADALYGDTGARSAVDIITSLPGGPRAIIEGNPTESTITTPWKDLNDVIGGIGAGDLVIVAGRPSMGKSVVGMQMAHHVAKTTDWAVHYHSLEMGGQTLLERLAAKISHIPADLIRARSVPDQDRGLLLRALREIGELPLYIDDDPRRHTVMTIGQTARRIARERPLGLVVIDHLQLTKGAGRHKDRREELTETVHSLKRMAGELRVPMMVLSQLNRQCEIERRQPGMADLKETGAIEEDADLVWFVHRPEVYRQKSAADQRKLRGEAKFIIGKHRNGKTGTAEVVFRHRFQEFVSHARGDVDIPHMSM